MTSNSPNFRTKPILPNPLPFQGRGWRVAPGEGCESRPIYLDYAATTPADPRVIQAMSRCLAQEGIFGNSASKHSFGQQANIQVEAGRKHIADLLHTVPRNIIFTSGATEANNLALKGLADFYKNKGRHMVTCQTEHKSVLDTCGYLERQGFEITYLKPEKNGLLDLEQLSSVLRPDTLLVSVMQVNNETGVQQDIEKISDITRCAGVFLHVDATQSVGKIPIDLQKLRVDSLSFSAHKFYGPKGIGALYIGDRPRVRLAAQIHGGGQERGMRAGTLATHQIVGFGEAARIAAEQMSSDSAHIQNCRDRFWRGIQDLPEIFSNADPSVCVPHIMSICFKSIPKEILLENLKDLAISNASACNTLTLEPSHVLRAMGLSDQEAERSMRVSFGRFSTLQEIDYAIECIRALYDNR